MTKNPETIVFVLLALFSFTSQAQTQQGTLWSPVTGPYGQYLSAVAETPKGIVLVGGSRGLFFSSDEGENWTRSTLNAYVVSILCTPKGTILVGSHEGLFRSSDGGATWNPTHGGGHLDPKCSDSLGNIYAVDPNLQYYIWRSSDDGMTWRRIEINNPDDSFYSLITDQRGTVVGSTSTGIVRSTDNGLSWSFSSRGSFGKGNHPRVERFALTQDGTIWTIGLAGLYTSRDHGLKWKKVTTNLPTFLPKGFFITNHGTMFATGSIYADNRHSIVKSNDNGKSWTECMRLDAFRPLESMIIDSRGLLYAASVDLLRSTNGGDNWEACNTGLGNDGVPVLAINSRGHIFAGTYWNLFRSTDNGNQWINIDTSLHIFKRFKNIIPCNGSLILLATSSNGVFLSTDNGRRWTPSMLHPPDVYSFIRHPTGAFYVATPGGSFMSSDNGKSWRTIGYGLFSANTFSTNASGTILVGTSERYETEVNKVYHLDETSGELKPIALDTSNNVALIPSSSRSLFAMCDSKVYVSGDNGVSWLAVHTSELLDVRDIVETSEGVLFAAEAFSGVFTSDDRGLSWKPFKRGLPDGGAYKLALHPDGHMYVSTSRGIFRTVNPVSVAK